MTATITLTIAGADTGPFDLYSDVTSYLSAFDSNVPKSSLVAGFTTSNIPDGTTTIRVVSRGTCTNYIDITLAPRPACKEFLLQGRASLNNIVTYKDCATGAIMTAPLSNGESIVVCAYSDTFSYPVFTTGNGIIGEFGDCGLQRGCIQYLLFAFPGEGGATFRYIPCGESSSIEVPVTDGNTLTICTNPLFVPELISGNGSATDTTFGCTTSTTTAPL